MSNKNTKDSLGDRMKENYENRSKTYLTRRTPVIIRLDGKAFHSFTRGFQRPYDRIFHDSMNSVLKYLCENIQGCKFGYTQSDEISLLITDFDTLTTDAWFGYSVQKMCSVAASMATMVFNRIFTELVDEYNDALDGDSGTLDEFAYCGTLLKAVNKGAMFDARCFNIPEDEVVNCFVWRQQDATRNAIQMLGQCNFSNKELDEKSCDEIQEMLMTQKGINFNDMPIAFKRGVCCKKDSSGKWHIDLECPIFTKDREYINSTIIKTYE